MTRTKAEFDQVKELMCQAHGALLGIRVTQSNPRNLSVSRRDSVAILGEIVGAKA